MAHEIEQMMYVGARPWHGLGVHLDEAPTIGDAIRHAGLDWVVRTQPLMLRSDFGRAMDGGTVRDIPAQATVRDSDGAILGIVGPDYKILQNADAFNFFQPFVESGAAFLETAGSLRGGRRVWVLAKLPATSDIIPGDAVESYLLLSNSHDGTMAVRVGYTPIRVVCANTLAIAHTDKASQYLRIRHVGDPAAALEEVQRVMNLASKTFEATAEQYRKLAAHDVVEADIRAYVREVFVQPKAKTNAIDVIDAFPVDAADAPDLGGDRVTAKILELVESGRGADLRGVRGTLWGAYNAVTEYVNHERGNNVDIRLDSLWFGNGAAISKRALGAALKMAA
jgi:phage/plasmid-like protein (TIGR03299 family)